MKDQILHIYGLRCGSYSCCLSDLPPLPPPHTHWYPAYTIKSIKTDTNPNQSITMNWWYILEINEQSMRQDFVMWLSIDQLIDTNRYQLTNWHRLVSIDRLVFWLSIFINCVRRVDRPGCLFVPWGHTPARLSWLFLYFLMLHSLARKILWWGDYLYTVPVTF